MGQQSIGQRLSSVARTIARPFSALLAYVMKAKGRTDNQTHVPRSSGDLDDRARAPRRKQKRGRRHGGRR